MFKFADPSYLWLLVAVALLVVLRFYNMLKRRRLMSRLGDKQLLAAMMPDVSRGRPTVKFWLLISALALMIVMLARPQMGSKISNDKRNGIETIIALDISNSMLAQDVVPSRLEKSKMLVESLVDNFTNDKIGLVVFAGDAFVQLPITNDYVSAKMFLHDISPSLITTQGTDLARAINLSASSFTQQQGVGRAIIVITDGEDHEGGAEEAVKAARKKGINVFILGIGSNKGAPIPLGGDYLRMLRAMLLCRLSTRICVVVWLRLVAVRTFTSTIPMTLRRSSTASWLSFRKAPLKMWFTASMPISFRPSALMYS